MPSLSDTPSTRPIWKSPVLLCLTSHVTLIIIYVVLIVLASHHFEHGFNMAFTTSAELWFSLAVSLISQTFGTVYLALLVLLTQRIALSHSFHTRQPLTAVHDKASAWLGLGSSLSVLKNQFSRPAALSQVTVIALYLGGITTLHVAIPASSTVNVYNTTQFLPVQTESARTSGVRLDASFYDILSVYGQFTTLGLIDNIIYDVIPVVPSGFGVTTVDATAFSADCGALPDAAQLTYLDNGLSPLWNFTIADGITATFSALSTNVIATSPNLFLPTADHQDYRPIVFASTFPVVDSNGTATPVVKIDPVIKTEDQYALPVSSYQMFACNLQAVNTTIDVSSVTRVPVQSLPVPESETRTWHDWAPIPTPSDPILASMSLLADNSPIKSDSQYPGDPAGTSLTAIDFFFMEDLGVLASNFRNFTVLSDLEESIGKVAAAIAWYQRNKNYSTEYTTQTFETPGNYNLTGEAAVPTYVLRMRLHFVVVPLIVGLCVSCLLLALACTQMWNHDGQPVHYNIDQAGVLQLAWLMGDEPRLRGVAQPTETELREAGMFEVDLGELLRQKACQPEESDVELARLVNKESIA